MDTANHLRDASPWRAEPDPVKLAILGKLAEELGELQAAVARCIIQGHAGAHPVTEKPNMDWLYEEMVDVQNLFGFVHRHFPGPSPETWHARMQKKEGHIRQWIESFP